MSMPVSEPDTRSVERARPVPRISIQIFCEYPETAQVIEVAAQDRRLSKAHVAIHMGGIAGAIAHYQEASTPNLVIVECGQERKGMLAELDRMAEYCDAETKVIVIGHVNDVLLYRELVRRGVSEYVIAPIRPLQIMESISNLYNNPDADPVGHVLAFVGAKGGVGASTICHNVAWTLSEIIKADVVIADLDLPFGTAGLDFNQDPVQGIADALSSPDRLDEVLLDRLLSKVTDYLSLFAAPGVLDRNYDIPPESFEWVIDVVRQNVPYLALDIPHIWTPWTRQQLLQADEVVIVATPDLACLRNAKNIVDLLKEHRNNDIPPHLVINQVGLPKRPEIPVKDFAEAVGLQPKFVVDFDGETFGQAANNGQMVAELNDRAKAAEQFRQLALVLCHRTEMRKPEKSSVLSPLLQKLKLRK
ncbi:MAG: CtpF protein [Rhizobiales bacterium]|nr:CtpF protein [Hyphomicrobiales bacterium]